MIPFALDLISTFVTGSTLPVATTDRTMAPRSAVASRDGSMSVDAPRRLENPHAAAPSRMTTAAAASHFPRPALSNVEGPFFIYASCLAPAMLSDTSCDDL